MCITSALLTQTGQGPVLGYPGVVVSSSGRCWDCKRFIRIQELNILDLSYLVRLTDKRVPPSPALTELSGALSRLKAVLDRLREE